ncbi:MAG: M15 family metallopeptidase [Cyanobacteria bacterium J06635_15]
MKPYQKIPIKECREPLVPIPLEKFTVVTPHPYQRLGAPYGDRSPYFVRQSVLQNLQQAQALLQASHPSWHLHLFDAYRPIGVQQFMVDYTFNQIAADQGLSPTALNDSQRQHIQTRVDQFWASPSHNPATPPPHSTGAAIDITLSDAHGTAVNMGSPIDEPSPRSFPSHFADNCDPVEQAAHQNRQRLYRVMVKAGFCRHPNEWWHFSYGDQLWAWQQREGREGIQDRAMPDARYGSI